LKSSRGTALSMALIILSAWSIAAGFSGIRSLNLARDASGVELALDVPAKVRPSAAALPLFAACFPTAARLVDSNPAVAIAFAPSLLLILVISALLGIGAHYLRQIQKTKAVTPITVERVPLEKTFSAKDARFRALVENGTNALILFDGEGEILYCNKASERILGHPPEELVGRNGFDCIHLNDQATVQAALRQSIEKPGTSVTVRARALHKDRSPRLLEGVFNNLLHDPDVQAIVNNYRDITETAAAEVAWRESEERFAKAFRSGPLAMSISTQAEGRYLDVNEAFLEMLGYERKDVIRSTAMDLNIWAESEDRARMLRELTNTGVVKELRAKFRKRSGDIRDVSVSAELVELDRSACVLAITQDVTEARRLEDHLRQVQKMEALGRLAGGVAHDFNNILGVIMGYSEISMDRLDSAHHLYKNLAEIKRGAQRAASLTRQLLAFTRQQVLYPRVLDLNSVVTNLDQMLQRMIGEDVSLSFKPGASLGWVKVDLGQIEQILMNLVVNARDAMPNGGKITIETSNVEIQDGDLGSYFSVRPGAYVLLSITDTGCGMDQKTMASIFEPFFTTKGPGQGTGLGLSTVYGIVKQSDGYIVVFSEPDKGTSFKLYFPRRDEESADSLAGDVSQEEAPQGSETILVVEDDESLRQLTVRFLEGAGYRVLQAENAPAALQLVGEFLKSLDLLLIDMIMPAMSGIELSERLRMSQPNLKVLLMSGYAGEYTARYGVAGASTPLLEKPFTRRELLSKISAVLHG
jgi:two-component system cell cycle sensor histidine kinase/response regulator CckA